MRVKPIQRGFTLVELLLALVILAVLLAIMFSAVNTARNAAGNAQCVNNLRRVGVAFAAYASDHNGVLYLHYNSASGTTRWSDCLIGIAGGGMGGTDYLQNGASVMICPSVAPKSYTSPLTGFVYGSLPSVGTDPKDTAAFNPVAGTFSRAVKLVRIPNPASYWLLADSWSIPYSKQIYIIYPTKDARVHLRHQGKANFLFADGHVQALGPKELPNLSPNPLFNAYDKKNQPVEF